MNNTERTSFNKLKYEGQVFKTNNYGDLIIVCYYNSKKVLVRFLETGYETCCQLDKLLQGKVKDKFTATVFGVGIIGEESIRCNGSISRSYTVWSNMLKRCYNTSSLESRPSYKQCYVSKDFTHLKMFNDWYKSQIGSTDTDEAGKAFSLDKDILIKGNKVYSPETCCFVPNEINAILLKHDAGRGKHPIGVTYHKATGKYRSTLSIFNQSFYLGLYDCEVEAFQAYKVAKERYIKEVAEKWKDKIDERVYMALNNWEVIIND